MKKQYIIFDLDWTLIDSTTKDFFEWTLDTLNALSKNYQLFLTSRSSIETIREKLTSAWIYEIFDVVMWGDVIEKSAKHIEVFEMYSEDTNFSQKAVYVWDSEFDEIIAEESYIPYICMWWWPCFTRYTISSIKQLEETIKKVR